MNNEKYNQIIDEAWVNYKNHNNDENGYECKLAGSEICIKLQFINKCKTDTEFSEKWGLKIEEKILDLKGRQNWLYKNKGMFLNNEFCDEVDSHKNFDYFNVPRKLITITYNNETIEVYE